MSPSILSERYKSNSDIHLEKTLADLIPHRFYYDVSCHTVIHTRTSTVVLHPFHPFIFPIHFLLPALAAGFTIPFNS